MISRNIKSKIRNTDTGVNNKWRILKVVQNRGGVVTVGCRWHVIIAMITPWKCQSSMINALLRIAHGSHFLDLSECVQRLDSALQIYDIPPLKIGRSIGREPSISLGSTDGERRKTLKNLILLSTKRSGDYIIKELYQGTE